MAGLFDGEIGRLLKQNWDGKTQLFAEEVFETLRSISQNPLQGPLNITQPPGLPAINITQGDLTVPGVPSINIASPGGTLPPVIIGGSTVGGWVGPTFISNPGNTTIGGFTPPNFTSGNFFYAPGNTIVGLPGGTGGLGFGNYDPATGGPAGTGSSTTTVAGNSGGSLLGKVTGGSGGAYGITLTDNTAVTATPLNVAAGETVSPGTWVVVSRQGNAFVFVAPVWGNLSP